MTKLSYLRGQVRSLLHGYCRAAVNCRASARARSMGGRLRVFLRSDSEGQSLLEFAFVLPMMLMVLTFMFSLSMALISYEQLSAAVIGAAQQDLANALVVSGGDPCALIATAVSSSLPASFSASKLTYTVTILNSSGQSVPYGPTTGSGFTCPGAVTVLQADENAGQQTTSGTLTVSYPYTWIPAYLQNMTGSLSFSQSVLIIL